MCATLIFNFLLGTMSEFRSFGLTMDQRGPVRVSCPDARNVHPEPRRVHPGDGRASDGKRGLGLFAYLSSLQSSNGDRRDIIAMVFEGTINRMVSGYLLRNMINKVNEIHFTSQDEIHTLGQLYESMLREMRDAAGDSGEFYTCPYQKLGTDRAD